MLLLQRLIVLKKVVIVIDERIILRRTVASCLLNEAHDIWTMLLKHQAAAVMDVGYSISD